MLKDWKSAKGLGKKQIKLAIHATEPTPHTLPRDEIY